MTPALAIWMTLLMTLLPDSDYLEVLAALIGDLALVHRHFGTTSRYEWMFWEMAYHKQGWPV